MDATPLLPGLSAGVLLVSAEELSAHAKPGPRPSVRDAAACDARGATLVSDRDGTHAAARPTAAGALTRLAYAQARAAGVDVGPILKTTHLTLPQIEDPGARLGVRDQITFLNRVATDLQDDFLGFHLADPRFGGSDGDGKRLP
jgi:hypothetical protein